MCLNIDKYRGAVQPKNTFELLPRPILEQMLRGFFYQIRKGVTLLWSEYDYSQKQWKVVKDRIDPFAFQNPAGANEYPTTCAHLNPTDD